MQERAVLTRQAVILGAAKSFEKFGYSASLGTILQHGGVSKGAIYFHFASKEELAHAVIAAQHGMAMEGTRRVAAHSDIAVETLVLVSQEMARQLVTEPIARGGMRLTMEIGSIQGPIEQPYLDWIEAIKQVATQAAEAGDIVPGTDIDALARFVVGSFTGVQILSEMLTGRNRSVRAVESDVEPGAAKRSSARTSWRTSCKLAALAPREWEAPSA